MNVYCITFPNTKRYVGVEGKTNSRKWAHSRSSFNNRKTLVARAIRKYGWDNCIFSYIVMDETATYCYSLEKELISKWNLQDSEFGYNLSSGGEAGFRGVKMSESHKRKIGLAHIGRKVSPETCKLLSAINSGKTLTEEHKKNISLSLTGRHPRGMKGKKHKKSTKKKISKAVSGKRNPFFGKTHTAETIAKIVASNKRRARK